MGLVERVPGIAGRCKRHPRRIPISNRDEKVLSVLGVPGNHEMSKLPKWIQF